MEKNDVSSKESVAKRLVWLRNYLGLNQSEFAESIDANRTQLNNWEKGRQRLSLEGALKINAVYGTTLDFLYLDRRSELPLNMLKDLSSSPLERDSSLSNDKPDS